MFAIEPLDGTQLRLADQPVLYLQTLFPLSYPEAALKSQVVTEWIEQAENRLRMQVGSAYGELPVRPQSDLKEALARFLAQLLLMDPSLETLNMAVEFWVEAQAEFLLRLAQDREEIEKIFLGGRSCGPVAAIASGLSDRHHHGRSVAAVTFESGVKLIYKPRDVRIEEWYFRFLHWLAAGALLPFKPLTVIEKDGYGWIEFAEHRVCRSKSELSNYYRNAGALLCTLYVLRARDCHFQNVVASGAYPVLVDAERLFHPRASTDPDYSSVADTGLIPDWRRGPEGRLYDVSGLGCIAPRTTPFRIPVWTAQGVQFAPGVLTPRVNVPFGPQAEDTPRLYAGEIAHGFSWTYGFLMEHREELLVQISDAAKEPIRYVIRDTAEYYVALNRFPRGAMLSKLTGPRAVFEPLRGAEMLSLRELDIPRFVLAASDRSLCEVEGCFPLSGYEAVCAGIDRLNPEDLSRQLKLIQMSWNLFHAAELLSGEHHSQ